MIPFTPVRLLRWAVATMAMGGGLMALAGDWRSPYLWAFTAGWSAVALYATAVVDPELARERFRPPTPGLDPVALRLVRLTALATVVLAPLDSGRWHLSTPMPDALRTLGVAGAILGFLLFVHAMSVNRFFSTVIRIQDERGHHIVDRGPYSLVRHPGYAGMIVASACLPLALGSWWACVPAGILVLLGLRRVLTEDRFLRENLPGYVDYAARVRARLLPGMW